MAGGGCAHGRRRLAAFDGAARTPARGDDSRPFPLPRHSPLARPLTGSFQEVIYDLGRVTVKVVPLPTSL